MNKTREDNAVNAYFKLLQNKGGDEASIKQRLVFFDQLIPQLVDKPLSGSVYREVIEAVMETQDSKDWPANLVIAREYFPFWMGDIKAISHLSSEIGFDFHPVGWMPTDIAIADVWKTIEQEKFTTAESWALKSYTKALQDTDATQEIVDVRTKMAKILVIRLRDAPITQKNAFRIAVDATIPLFELKNTRKLFLIVVREFFNFWSGNPDAKDFVFKSTKVSLL